MWVKSENTFTKIHVLIFILTLKQMLDKINKNNLN